MATHVRILPEAYRKLRMMAETAGKTMPDVLAEAIDRQYRRWLLAGLAEDYGRLKAGKKAWAQEEAERALWDKTPKEGMKDL